jgi:hypothetical protein
MRKADVFIQAGHEGRVTGATGATGPLGDEIEWTPIVADEATRVLREAGVSVIREAAALEGVYDVKVAIFIHFDGANPADRTGASVGYNDPTDQPAAHAWKALYGKYWPFRWMPDNFTRNLSGYYGFSHTRTTDAEFVMELGEISCRAQAEWLSPRLQWLGQLIAHFLSQRLGQGNLPDPGPWGEAAGPEPLPAPLAPSWSTFYGGLDLEGFSIPRKGLSNRTLQRVQGIGIEPLGEVVRYLDRDFVQGKVSWFGGPQDRTMAADDAVGLTLEPARSLSADDYYAAMRWDYRGRKAFWVNRHLLVVNPANNRAVIVRAIDWGPNIMTGRILDLSPRTLDYLGAQTDAELVCAFATTHNDTRQVGPVPSQDRSPTGGR